MPWWRRRQGEHDPLVCREFVELVTDYLEGTLPDTERARFEAHLAECDGCTGYLEDMRRVVASLHEVPEPPPTQRRATHYCARSATCAATPDLPSVVMITALPPRRASGGAGARRRFEADSVSAPRSTRTPLVTKKTGMKKPKPTTSSLRRKSGCVVHPVAVDERDDRPGDKAPRIVRNVGIAGETGSHAHHAFIPLYPVASLAAVPAVAAVLVLGVWVAGGLVSDDYRTSMGLTAVWFLLSGAACLAIARRARPVRVAVIATYVVTVGAVGAYLAATTLRDRVVNGRSSRPGPRPRRRPPGGRRRPRVPVELAQRSLPLPRARDLRPADVVRLADGRRFLTLTSFATSPGPDLRVRLVTGESSDGGAAGAVDLGALKGNRGDQQYRVPIGVQLTGRSVVVWCRAFSAPFGSARLRAA